MKLKLLMILQVVLVVFSLSVAPLALADSKSVIKQGAGDAAGNTGNNAPDTNINNTIAEVINLASVFAGALAVIMLIIGGFRYVSSAGNPEAAKSARNTILYAVIGLVIVALAQIVVHFVLDNVDKAVK